MARRKKKKVLRKILSLSGAAALAMYFFDPQMGRTRRSMLQSRLGGMFRRGLREAERKTEYAKGHVAGITHGIATLGKEDLPPPNDAALTAKIQSEVISGRRYPKGSININACDGVVELRGTLSSQSKIDDLEQEVRKISGVVDVHNYLTVKTKS